MLDIGWSEMAIIAVIALFVIGPKELPRMLRTIGRYAARIRGMAREFQDGIDEAVRDAELDEVKKQIESARSLDIGKTIENTVDPERRIGKAMDFSDAAKPAAPAKGGTDEKAGPPEDTPAGPPGPPRAAKPAQGMAASLAAAAPPAAPPPAGESAPPAASEPARADA